MTTPKNTLINSLDDDGLFVCVKDKGTHVLQQNRACLNLCGDQLGKECHIGCMEVYEKDNKHIFNEYGIELRRGELYDLAIENYKKAISIDDKDEALYFNIARAYQESGQIEEAVKSLEKAILINPDFKEAKAFQGALKNSARK